MNTESESADLISAGLTRVGVLIPSTNSAVEQEFGADRMPGVSFHYARMRLADGRQTDDESFKRVVQQVRSGAAQAIESILDVQPKMIVYAVSVQAFWGGVAGSARFQQELNDYAKGVEVLLTSTATLEGLAERGVKKLGVLTPYQSVGTQQVETFLNESGYEVTKTVSTEAPDAFAIAQAGSEQVWRLLNELVESGCDAILQSGTNLALVDFAQNAASKFGMPVLTMNGITLDAIRRRVGR